MPCIISTLTRSVIKKTTRKNKQQKKPIPKIFEANTQYLKLKAPSNNVKMQSDKTLTKQTYFFLTIQQKEIFLNETRSRVDNEKKQ